MLELYHSINSVCAQKIRLALNEKKLPCSEHLMKLNGDQFDPAYLKLNPNGVVPTLIHDGQAITESAVILYYLDEVFPNPSLMPKAPIARAKVRQFNKLIDEYMHNSCMILTFATAFRPALLRSRKPSATPSLRSRRSRSAPSTRPMWSPTAFNQSMSPKR
jgi:Glutathione S-transferase